MTVTESSPAGSATIDLTDPTVPPDAAGAGAGQLASTADPRSGSSPGGDPPGPPPGDEPSRWSLRRVTTNGWITVAIGVVATFIYTWSLNAVGYANDYYAAAVKSMSVSWKAFFFGSIDSGNFITVDKPPGALWVQALSARIFGFSSWSMLLPEAIMGVASVLILHRLVRKWAGDLAAHIAALAFAVTPVAVVMFRYNNPDAFLTFLCLAAAWALWSALESGRTRMLVLSAALMGLAFDTKMLQAFLVLPAFILVYIVAGKPRLRTRLLQLTAALGTMIITAGWWVAVVALWPAADRPYIGSTDDNSILSLIFGYNGLSRLFGQSAGGATSAGGAAAGGGGGGAMFGGAVSWLRMFNTQVGGQIAWLIPIAFAGLLAGLWLTRRAPRIDLARAGWLLWGGWAATCFVVFSRAQGIFHPYYTIQLAPALAALAGAGSIALWKLGRTNRWMIWALPAAILATATLAVALLDQTPTYDTWLRPLIIGGATLAAVGLWLGSSLRHKTLVVIAASVAFLTLLAGPIAYTVTTVQNPVSGPLAAAGPASTSNGFGGGGAAPGGAPGGGRMGGSQSSTADAALISYLEANRGDATYLVAAFTSQSSASIIIASGEPVMTIGGFNGADPAPTLAQFQQLVANGTVRYVLVGGGMGGGMGGGPGGAGTSSAITSWVTANGHQISASTYGGTGTGGTLYDVGGVTA